MNSLERDYGHLYHGHSLNRWLQFADRFCEIHPTLIDVEETTELVVNYQPNLKIQALLEILDKLDQQQPRKSLGKSGSKQQQKEAIL